jgi:hypothetical protein
MVAHTAPMYARVDFDPCSGIVGNRDHVIERVYPGMGHTINDDEIRQVTKLIAQPERHEKMK